MKRQWHPLFARLLRPLVESHYEVQTGVPVGDAPRLADVVLLRRTSDAPPPFLGLWRNLTTWNILEFKGPTVAARPGDIDLLIELGLGIHRRLNEQRVRDGQSPFGPAEVSFWYLANRLGRRFLGDVRDTLGEVEPLGPGVWRCTALRRLVFLVSGADAPVERDSLPLHIISEEPTATGRRVAQFLAAHPALWDEYSGFLATLHPDLWDEVRAMSKTTGKRRKFDFYILPVIEEMGLNRVIEQIGLDKLIQEVGLDKLIQEVGLDKLIQEVGLPRLIEKGGLEGVVREKGLPWLLSQLTPEQRRELKKLL